MIEEEFKLRQVSGAGGGKDGGNPEPPGGDAGFLSIQYSLVWFTIF